MTQAAPTLSEADALRADIYRLIAALLREAPTEELLGWLASLDIEQDGSRLAECWHGLSQAANSVDAASLKRAHFGARVMRPTEDAARRRFAGAALMESPSSQCRSR